MRSCFSMNACVLQLNVSQFESKKHFSDWSGKVTTQNQHFATDQDIQPYSQCFIWVVCTFCIHPKFTHLNNDLASENLLVALQWCILVQMVRNMSLKCDLLEARLVCSFLLQSVCLYVSLLQTVEKIQLLMGAGTGLENLLLCPPFVLFYMVLERISD